MIENMQFDIPYGKEKITVNMPYQFEVLKPKKVVLRNEDEIIKKALDYPIEMASIKKFIKKSNRLLIIVNDASKPTPTSKILEHIYPDLTENSDFTFLVATGSHRAPNNDELQFIFGRFYDIFKDRILIHNALDNENMIYLGETKAGTEVSINKLVFELGNVIVIGSVEPHYFAGCTGGRKSFTPGVASYKTIEMNHQYALSEKANPFALKGNPVHDDLTDALCLIKNVNIFSIQSILTSDNKIYDVVSGDIFKSYDYATKIAKELYCVPIKQKGNIVITVVPYPMDIDLYQSQNSFENAKLALEDDGIIIIVTKCRMGVGKDAFIDLLCTAKTPQEVFDKLGNDYKLGYHKAARIAKIRTRSELWAVTDLDDEIIKKAMMKPYKSIQSAINDAIKTIKEKGKQPKIFIMPSGNYTIPIIEK